MWNTIRNLFNTDTNRNRTGDGEINFHERRRYSRSVSSGGHNFPTEHDGVDNKHTFNVRTVAWEGEFMRPPDDILFVNRQINTGRSVIKINSGRLWVLVKVGGCRGDPV